MLQTDRSNDLHCSVRVSLWGSNFFVARILIYVHMPYAHDVSQDIKDMFGFFFYIKMRTVLIVNFFYFFLGIFAEFLLGI